MLNIQWSGDLPRLIDEAGRWDELSGGVALRESGWLVPWWDHHGNDRAPALVTGRDDDGTLRALLLLYACDDRNGRRVLRSFGDGTTCTDYTTILVDDGLDSKAVAGQFAEFLVQTCGDKHFGWDSIVLDGIVEHDATMRTFASQLSDRGASVHCQSQMHVWHLPCNDYDDYLAAFARDKRSRQRRMIRKVEKSEDLRFATISEPNEVHLVLDQLIDTHQARWTSVGQLGSFDQPEARHFLHDVADRFLADGRFWLVAIMRDRDLLAGAASVIGQNSVAYCYCTGNDLSKPKLSLGNTLNAYLVRQSHERGYRGINFLRGDEAYKARLHAQGSRLLEMRIANPQMVARLRHAAWLTQFEVRQFVRRRLGRTPVDTVTYGSPA